MLMSDFVDWLIPDIPKDISLQMHKEKILMVELFMKEEHGKRLAAKENHNRDSCISHSSPKTRSRPVSHANCWWSAGTVEGNEHKHANADYVNKL